MRTWLLLVSLLVSGLSPLGDRDWIMDHLSRPWCCKLLLRRQRTPGKGLDDILMQTEYRSASFPRHNWACRGHSNHGDTRWDGAGIHRIHFTALGVSPSYEDGNRVLAFPALLKNLPALHVICKICPIAVDMIRNRLESWSAWLLHQSTASGNNFPVLVLKKSKSWAQIAAARLQKMLTKSHCMAVIVIISCCSEDGETKLVMNIEAATKQEVPQPQARQKQSTQQALDRKVLLQCERELFLISEHDFKTAVLNSGSSSGINPNISQLDIQTFAATVMKTNGHFDLDKDSDLQKSFQRQLPLKAASAGDADGFHVERQLLLVSRENKGSINRPKYAARLAQEDNNEYFSGKIITKATKLRCLEAECLRKKSHAHTVENRSEKILAYIQQTQSPQKTRNDDVNVELLLSDTGEEALLLLILQDVDKETHTEPQYERKLPPNTGIRWKTVNIPSKELSDPPPFPIAAKVFISEENQSTYTCLSLILELYLKDRREMTGLRSAKREAEVTTASATTEHSGTNNVPQENVSIRHIKNENMTPKESVTPPPHSFKTVPTETTATGVVDEPTTVNTEIEKTTTAISEISTESTDEQPSRDQSSTTARNPEPQTDTKFNHSTTESPQTTTMNLLWGLRMREDVLAITTEPNESMDNEDKATTNWAETEGKDEDNPGVTLSKPQEAIQEEAADRQPKTTGDTVTRVPLCTGLIHRTKAGWKHCMDRLRGQASKIFSPSEVPGTRELEEEAIGDSDHNPLNNDENEHFYYFNGVLKRVQNNFYPQYKRQRYRRRRHSKAKDSLNTHTGEIDNQENLLSYIRRLTERNKLNVK